MQVNLQQSYTFSHVIYNDSRFFAESRDATDGTARAENETCFDSMPSRDIRRQSQSAIAAQSFNLSYYLIS